MSGRKKKASKQARFDLLINAKLKRWVQSYAENRHTTVTALVTDFFVRLKDREDRPDVEQI